MDFTPTPPLRNNHNGTARFTGKALGSMGYVLAMDFHHFLLKVCAPGEERRNQGDHRNEQGG